MHAIFLMRILTNFSIFHLCSPSDLSYEDTYNTLKYADRAMNIKCKVIKNEMSVDMHVSRYAKIVEELKLEVSCNFMTTKLLSLFVHSRILF